MVWKSYSFKPIDSKGSGPERGWGGGSESNRADNSPCGYTECDKCQDI